MKYTFSDRNHLQGTLRAVDDSKSGFNIETDSSSLGTRRSTKIRPIGSKTNTPTGVIDWENRKFVVGSESRDWSEVKEKAGVLNKVRRTSAQVWKLGGQTFVVDYSQHKGEWTAALDSTKDKPIITYTLRKSHVFKPSEPATIEIYGDISADDQMFLLLALLHSESQREDIGRNIAIVNSSPISGATMTGAVNYSAFS